MLWVLAAWLAAAPPARAQTSLEFRDDSQECVYRGRGCRGESDARARRSDDFTPYDKFRAFFFPEAGVDPMRRKYEELFGEAWRPPGNGQLEPSDPFAEVRKFDDAFERAAEGGARRHVEPKDGELTLSLVVPDSAERPLRLFVNDDRIIVSLGSATPPSRWRVERRREFSIPNPPDVDAASATVRREGDLIRIRFTKLD